MCGRIDRTNARLCYESVVDTCQNCTPASVVWVVLINQHTMYFSYYNYCKECLYLRPELRGCHIVKVPNKGDLLILTLGWSAFADDIVLLETPSVLLRTQPPYPPKQKTDLTTHLLAKV